MLERFWYIACASKELGKTPIAATILSRPVVLFRGESGRATALEDRCLHRGAPLSKGRVEGGMLSCPYHGWQYACDGRLASIPTLPAQDGPLDGCRVPCFSCIEQDGYVWVAPSLEPPMEAPRRFPFLGEPGWSTFRMTTHFQAPIELCLENFLDCPHATTVHKSWFRSPTAKSVRAVVRTLADGAEAEYFDEPREKSLVWALVAPSRKETMTHRDRFIAPATTQVDYQFSNQAGYWITSCCTPITEESTRVSTVITFRFAWLTPLIRIIFEPMARRIIRQDVEILHDTQANRTRFGRTNVRVIPQDLLYPHIRQWRNALRQGVENPVAGREEHVDLRL
ncbi:MAG: aromatic ring-hydroxylating dioxygenase subunit alpha [Bryobacteraceae bacterium]